MMKIKKMEALVGLFLLLGLFLVGGGIVMLGDFGSQDKNSYVIWLKYRDSAGLIKGSGIRMGGAKVGFVSSQPQLTEEGSGVVLQARIYNGIHIQEGSQFKIDMQNLLGDKYIDVVPPKPPTDKFIQPGSRLTGHSDSDLSKLRANAVNVSNDLANLLNKLNSNSDGLLETMEKISTSSKQLSEATRKINEVILSDSNLAHLSNILENIDQGSKDVPALMGEAKSSLTDFKAAMADARSLIGGAEERLAKLDAGIDQFGPTMTALRGSADRISLFTKDINTSKGALWMLMKDEKFRKEFEEFIRNLRDYGILRYRNPNEPQPSEDPRGGYSGSRR